MNDRPIDIRTGKPVSDKEWARRKRKAPSGIPAGGPGWGGPAKGASRSAGRVKDYHWKGAEEYRAARLNREALAEEALSTMATLMRTSPVDQVRLGAAAKIIERVEGAPLQRNLNAEVDAPDMFAALKEIAAISDAG